MAAANFESDESFVVLHALRIKGFSSVGALCELSGSSEPEAQSHLEAWQEAGNVKFREPRSLWQITPEGKVAHLDLLETDAGRDGFRSGIAAEYQSFLGINEELKHLCTNWQLMNGNINDHSNAAYDQGVIQRLHDLNERATPIVSAFGSVARRMAGYAPRLGDSVAAVMGGDTRLFTGVMCGSFHDVWMELHEDLILTLQIDRSVEGSF